MPEEMTIQEMQTKLLQLDANITDIKKIADTYKAEEEKKKEEEEKKAKKAAEEEEKKKEAGMDDEEKKKMQAKKAEEEEKKKDEENAALKAEVTFLRNIAKKPMVEFLQAAYKGSVTEEELESKSKEWSAMTVDKLNAEVERVKPFVANRIEEIPHQPIMFSGPQLAFEAASSSEPFVASLKKQNVNELFGGVNN